VSASNPLCQAKLSQSVADAIEQFVGFRTDPIEPKYDVFVALHRRHSRLGDAVGREKLLGLSGGGETEEPGVKPWLGIVERAAKRGHSPSGLAGRQ